MNRRTAAGRLQWWVLRSHWLLGIASLALYLQMPPWPPILAAAAWAAGAWMDRQGAPRVTFSRLGTPVVALLIAIAAADLLFAGRDLLRSVIFLVLGIQSTLLLLPKRAREGWQLCAVSFLEFLVSASVAGELSFAPLAFLYLVASAGAMWGLHDQRAAELGRPAGGYAPSRRLAAATLLLVGVAGSLAAALLFAVVPRLEFRRGLQRFVRGNAVSGFSDEITLREITGVKSDRRTVARVEFPFLDREPDPGSLYLRGAVYSRYANGGWRLAASAPSAIPRAGFHHVFPETPRGPVTVADITLEPAGHPRLFTYGSPVLIEGNFGPLLADAEGNLFLPQPGHPTMRYRLRFAEEPPHREGPAGGPGSGHLEFPEGHEDVRALGIGVAGSAGTAAERAARALGFFRSGFRYSLSDPAPTLRRFLFEEKTGYCEHYAAALALLLRAGGIPSRVAVGYLGGEWNGLGRYLIVRQSDAHAWVEAWIDGRWVTMDATPPQGEASPFFRKTGPVGLYADWLRQRWDKYVVNYSVRMQADAVSAGWRGVRRTGKALGFVRGSEAAAKARHAALPAMTAAAALWLLLRNQRERKRGAAAGEGRRLPAPYARLLRRLERSGFRPSPGVPMEEMLAAAVRARPEMAEEAGRFLPLYHRDRFGPEPLPRNLRAETCRLAEQLRKRVPPSDGRKR